MIIYKNFAAGSRVQSAVRLNTCFHSETSKVNPCQNCEKLNLEIVFILNLQFNF